MIVKGLKVMRDHLSNFDWVTALYDETRALPDDLYTKLEVILRKFKLSTPSMRSLEIGVGTGRIATVIANALECDVYGVDISEKMLHQYFKNHKRSSNVHMIAADGFFLPFAKKFDLILTSHVLHQVEDHFGLVGVIMNCLKPSGSFIDLNAYVDLEQTLPFQIFYKYLEENGYVHTFRNDMIRKELKIFFSRKNWEVEEMTLESQYSIKQNKLLQYLKNKVYSHQRRIPDRLYRNALNYLFTELERLDSDFSMIVEAPAYAHLLGFTPKITIE
jgi:ubiquinone/menaquinone biosynthesis C-methylase UbiE